MEKEFEALDWLNDTLGYFLNKTTDTHCQITLTRNQATEFVEEHKKVEQFLLELQQIKESKPSEAMDCLEKIKNRLFERFKSEDFSEDFIKGYEGLFFEPIKQALLKAQEDKIIADFIREHYKLSNDINKNYLELKKPITEEENNKFKENL